VHTLGFGFACLSIRRPLFILIRFESGFFLRLSPRLLVLPLVFLAKRFGFEFVPVAIQLC
jgi:hypothetical protein